MMKKASLLLTLLLTFALVLSACATGADNNSGLNNGLDEPGVGDDTGFGDGLGTEQPGLGDELATEAPDQGFGISTESAAEPGAGDGTTSEPSGMGGVTPEPGAGDVTTTESAGEAGGLPVAEEPGADLNRVSNLIGHQVTGPAGEDLGSIDSLIVDSQSGQIAYALVQAGDALEIEDEFVAIPWSELDLMDEPVAEEGVADDDGATAMPGDDTTATETVTDTSGIAAPGETQITYSGDLATVQESPGMTADDLGEGDILAAGFDSELSSYWANEVASLPQTGADETAVGMIRLRDVTDKQLTNAEGDDLGDIEDMIIDRANNAISWVIIGSGGFLDIGEELIPVPFEMLRIQPEQDNANESEFILNASDADLENAPRFQGGMPDTSLEGWDTDFSSYWEGIQPVEDAGTDAESATEDLGDY